MKQRLRSLGLITVALALLAALFHQTLLAAAGSYLVRAEAPQKADLALVLAGDYVGRRILAAAELARQGYVPKVLVSGPAGFYGVHECELSIPFAVKHGYPESYFLHFENDARSTAQEARDAVGELDRLSAHKVLLVTSDYHTRRAGNTFRDAAPGVQFVIVAAPDGDFTASGWWRTREGRKIWLMEWIKTVASWVRL